MTKDIAVRSEAKAPQIHASPLNPSNFGELIRFADIASKSGMVPKDYSNRPQAIVIACQMGAELGLAPMQSLQNIAVINGRPSVWGDTLLALVKASPVCDDVIETIEGDGDSMVATCTAKRRGKEPVVARFSMADARSAGLAGKVGPWKQYPKRMLQMRARGFALRDAFPDVLRGLITAEEALDIPSDVGGTKQSPVEQPKQIQRDTAEERRQKIHARTQVLIDSVRGTEGRRELEDLTASETFMKARNWLENKAPDLLENVDAAIRDRLSEIEEQELAELEPIQEMPE